MKPEDYAQAIAKAEKAVSTTKDPELKKIAFQKVLEDLLASPTSTKNENISSGKRSSTAAKAAVRQAGKGGPKAYVSEFIEDGFFKKPKSISEIRTALAEAGHHIPVTSLSGPLQKLCQEKRLRRQKKEGTYTYSEW